MMEIACPWCGPRDQMEFRCGGEAHIVRPTDSDGMSDAEWADYVFMRKNPKGMHHERWLHVHGCRRWFNMTRDTVTDRILAIYRIGETSPALEGHGDGTAARVDVSKAPVDAGDPETPAAPGGDAGETRA